MQAGFDGGDEEGGGRLDLVEAGREIAYQIATVEIGEGAGGIRCAGSRHLDEDAQLGNAGRVANDTSDDGALGMGKSRHQQQP